MYDIKKINKFVNELAQMNKNTHKVEINAIINRGRSDHAKGWVTMRNFNNFRFDMLDYRIVKK